MPTYKATAPDGRTVTVSGPTPPTEAEWDEIFTSVPAATKAPEGSALGRGIAGAASQLNPVPLVTGAVNAIAHPIDTLGNVINAQLDQFKKAKQAYDEGHYTEAAGHVGGGALPLFGPAAANIGERIAETGDVARGVGEGAGLAATVFAPRVVPKVISKTAQVAPKAASVVGRAAQALNPDFVAMVSPTAAAWVKNAQKAAAVLEKRRAAAGPVAGPPPVEPPVVPSTVGPHGGGYGVPATDVNIPGALAPPGAGPTVPPPGPPPGPMGNTVQPPPGGGVPPPPTTPANTPPTAAPITKPTSAPPVAPKVQAAAATISEWTPAEYNAVKDLPVKQRVAYLRMRQGGYAADDALDVVKQMQKAEQAQTLRAMKGSKKAAAELFNVSEKKVTPEMLARVKEMAPGPSRTPLEGVDYAMDERFKSIIKDDPRFQSLLRGGGLGDLATRGAP